MSKGYMLCAPWVCITIFTAIHAKIFQSGRKWERFPDVKLWTQVWFSCSAELRSTQPTLETSEISVSFWPHFHFILTHVLHLLQSFNLSQQCGHWLSIGIVLYRAGRFTEKRSAMHHQVSTVCSEKRGRERGLPCLLVDYWIWIICADKNYPLGKIVAHSFRGSWCPQALQVTLTSQHIKKPACCS